MIEHKQMRAAIIQPATTMLGLYSRDFEELAIMTMATESEGGYYLKQVGGPALGVYQMEAATHDDIWRNFISPKPALARLMQTIYSPGSPRPIAERMVYDLYYATAMARIFYERTSAPIPSCSDIEELALYYKRHWNTSLGAAEVQGVMQKYYKYIGS